MGEMRRTRINLYLISILLAVASVSCNRGTYYSDAVKMHDGQWSMYDPAGFACSFDDTVQVYDINLSVRTSTAYPYRNLFLFVRTTFPSGLVTADTVQAMLADEKGKWLGRGAGDVRELTIPYKTDVYFPEKGEYHFSVIQGMRDTVLKGVYDLEFRITRRDR
jgi:gliding motility-associated lipoprotein GldH